MNLAISDLVGFVTMACHESPKAPPFTLEVTCDGELGVCTLTEFLVVNELEESVQAAIKALQLDETYTDGGGAAPVWTVKRIH